jgi:hypothetical protein
MRLWLILISICAAASLTLADDKPASQPTTDAAVIQANDKDALTANMDKAVVIEGTIDTAAWSSSGKVMKATFKDAADSKLSAIIFVANREKFDTAFSGDIAKALTGAKVRLKGKLKDYKGSPEIVLDAPDQVTIVEAAPG